MTKAAVTALVVASILSGCSSEFLRGQEAAIRDTSQQARDARAKNSRVIDQSQVIKVPSVVVTDKTYLGVKPVPITAKVVPPEYLSRRVQVVQDVRSFAEVAELLRSIAKIQVSYSDDAVRAASSLALQSFGGASVASAPAAAPAVVAGVPASLGAAPSGAPAAGGSGTVVTLNYSGPMSGLFDLVATRFGLSWRVLPSGGVEYFYRETRTFTVMVLPGQIDVETNVGTTGGSVSGTGAGSTRNASQTTKAKVDMPFWKDLEGSIKASLSKDGVVTVNPAAGTVTVTDTPVALERVAKLIDGQNSVLTKQVLIDVKLVRLTLKSREQFGIDWALVHKSIGGNVMSLTSGASTPLSLQEGLQNLVFQVTDSGRKLGGTQALISALADQANIGSVTSAQQFALNNQATPIQVGTTTRFIEKVTRTPSSTPGVADTVTYETNSISSGVALQVLPRILDMENLLVHFSVDLSDEPENLALGDVPVSLFKQSVRNFMQRVSLRSGETLVLSGYEQSENNVQRKGAVTPDNLLMGGKRDVSGNKEVVVLIITPVIMDRIRS